MKDHSEIGASGALDRRIYAWRAAACVVGYFMYCFLLGAIAGENGADPASAFLQMMPFILVGNIVAGAFFVYFTHRRALDCEFGQNGKAWIATVAALPSIFLPQYALLVFTSMMFMKSAPEWEETAEFEGDTGFQRPLQPGE